MKHCVVSMELESKPRIAQSDPLDAVVNLLGELAAVGASLQTRAGNDTSLIETIVGMNSLIEKIHSTTLDIRLSQTVDSRLARTQARIDGFLVGVGKSWFVLPHESVVEVIESSSKSVKVDATGHHCLDLRGSVLPVVRLRTLYSVESSLPERVSVVVVHTGRGQYGIEVEVLLGQQQAAVKPLGRLFKTLRGISGASILDSGELALILDIDPLRDLATLTVDAQAVALSH